MYKTILKFFIFTFLLFFSLRVFASEAVLSLDKTKVDINDYINLRLQISITKWWTVEVSDIKWLENFDIIWQSQSQSSSTKVVLINWETKTELETILNLELTLQAKNKWKFSLWPAILKNNNEEIKSNIVEIEVFGDKLFMNNNHLNINTNTTSLANNSLWNNTMQTNNTKKEDVVIDTYDDIEKQDFQDNKELYLLFLAILLLLFWWYFFIKKKPNVLKDLKNNSFKQKKKEEIKQKKEEEIDFEKVKKDISYPGLTDNDFINKISDIFKQKLYVKYKIKDIYNKTFEEIKKEINNPDKDILLLIDLINKSKYSDVVTDNNQILSLIKKL